MLSSWHHRQVATGLASCKHRVQCNPAPHQSLYAPSHPLLAPCDASRAASGRTASSSSSSAEGPRRGSKSASVEKSESWLGVDAKANSQHSDQGSHNGDKAGRHSNRLPKHNPSELETIARATTSFDELQQLFEKHKSKLTQPEVVLMCNQLARLCDPARMTVHTAAATEEFFQKLLLKLDPFMSKLNTYECVVVLASVARLRYVPTLEWLGRFFEHSLTKLPSCGPGNLTLLIRSLSRIDMPSWELKTAPFFREWISAFLQSASTKLASGRGDELIRMLCSLADLQFRPPKDWMGVFSSAVKSKLDYMEPDALSKGMLAFAMLRYRPERPFIKAYYTQLYAKLPMFDDGDLASTAQALSMLRRLTSQDFLGEFYCEVTQKLGTFSPSALANLLAALARLVLGNTGHSRDGGFPQEQPPMAINAASASANAPQHLRLPHVTVEPPSQEWLKDVGAHVYGRLWQQSGNHLANSLWGLAHLGYPAPPSMLDAAIQATQPKLRKMRTTETTRLIEALGVYKYKPSTDQAAQAYHSWCMKVFKQASTRTFTPRQVCNLVHALGQLACPPAPSRSADFLSGLLLYTRSYNLRNTSPAMLARLAHGLQQLGYQPDFGFLHNYSQAARFRWSSFKPQEFGDLLGAIAAFNCPITADPLWAAEFLAEVRCHIDDFDAPALAALMRGATQLPGLRPSAQWLASCIRRAEELQADFSGPELSDLIIALGRLGYRPPAQVLDAFVHCISAKVHELPQGSTEELAQALMLLVPGYLGPSADDAGHREYHELQMKLRRQQLPHTVVLQPVSHGQEEPEGGGDLPGISATQGSSSSNAVGGNGFGNHNGSGGSNGRGPSTGATMSGAAISHEEQQPPRTEAALTPGGGAAPRRARALSA